MGNIMENINIDEIPLLDCRYIENNKILIKLFNNMKPVKNKNLSYKDDFKNDLDNIEELMNMICKKKKKEISAISYFKNKQYCMVYDKSFKSKLILATIYSHKLNELFLKVCVYCYYK